MKLLSNLFKKKSTPATRKVAPKLKPALETLEGRELMAAYIASGSLIVYGSNANDNLSVNNYNASYVRVNSNSINQYFLKSAITTGNVFFYGYAGNDYMANNVGTLQSVMYGADGNDTLVGDAKTDWLYGQNGDDIIRGYWGNDVLDGGAGNDKLYGMDGTDWLYGGDGNDKLYGGAGYDYLYGQNGDDFLDAGSSGEYVNGGLGYDYNAYVTAVNGATYTDIRQGSSPTCWLVSSISSVARTGVDLSARITYIGNDTYRVGMYNTSRVYTYYYVNFNGDRNSADAVANPSQEGESWVIITQRAYLQSRGISLTNPPGGWADGPLTAFTGRSSTTYNNPVGSSFAYSNFTYIDYLVHHGYNVVADTRDNAADLSTNMLIAWHQYTVVDTWGSGANAWVLVRNPWGYDGGATTYGDANDGFVWLTWSQFASSMDAYIVN
jgi:RTX calcium-binding nonapeptide repeat (4 copies)/Calpain family cysteine protease